ncbi:beta-N-acetylhexosaminidase [Paenibacillus radicis (ex Gao et al. 2016)]|uniref:Glycoside hydrolase family 3 n=1 Tax=Paenibacillus radicis (ex Gao et al. 2016) TaxID=1737354 RepID=A0A917M949_9BACL|nr:beta-N-acetylhexosaminidase [Paenibacillus radicis (ex Gao et al. 2016)]GGG83076.1 glycoside hydrolase family 3 [Paenibacillus radicis (ex Gao et al. 2016)]
MNQLRSYRQSRRRFGKLGVVLLIGVCMLLMQSCARPQANETKPSPTAVEQDPLDRQIADMSLEDKVGQMIIAGIDGKVIDPEASKMIKDERIGGIILYGNNISDLQGMVALVNALKQANAGNSVPLLISVDQEGGKVSRMPKSFTAIPSSKKVGATNNPALAEEMGTLLAEELKLTGFNMNFAPVLDVNSNPANPIIGSRSFGSTAELVSRMGMAEMKGIRENGIIPVVKHFPGHGDTSVDSHLELPVVNKTREELAKLEWLPFEAAIEQRTDAIMVAHILYPHLDPDKPASISAAIIGDVLRGKMGYDGVVMTDDLTMGAITKNYGLAEAALDSVQAGSDIVLIAHGYDNALQVRDTLLKSIQENKLSIEQIDKSVRRILSLKQRYQLNDETVPVPDLKDLNARIKAWINKL